MLLVCSADVQYVMKYSMELLDFDVRCFAIQRFRSEENDKTIGSSNAANYAYQFKTNLVTSPFDGSRVLLSILF